jgi:hypothetical protein
VAAGSGAESAAAAVNSGRLVVLLLLVLLGVGALRGELGGQQRPARGRGAGGGGRRAGTEEAACNHRAMIP